MKRLLATLALILLSAAGARAQCVPSGGGPATIASCPSAQDFQATDYILGMQAYNGVSVLQVPGRTVKITPLQLTTLIGGGGSGGGSTFAAPFPATGTAIGVQSGANMVGLKADGSGNLLVSPQGTASNGVDGIAPSSNNTKSLNFLYGYNGATYDSLRVDGSKNLMVNLGTPLPAGSVVDIFAHAGGIMDAAGQNAASPASELLIGGQFNTSPTTITTGNMSPLQLDSSGKLLIQAFQGTGTNFHIVCDTGCSSSSAPADSSTFTAASTSQSPVGGFFQTTATSNPLTTGHMGAVQMTAQRAFFTNLRDSSGNEEGLAGQPLQVSLANTAANGTAVTVSAAQSGTWTVGLSAAQSIRILGNAGASMDAAGQNVASPANSLLQGCQFNTTPTTITNGNMSPVQCDTGGRQLVQAFQATGTNFHMVCDSGCSSSTAPADEAAFSAGVTPQSPVGGFFQTTATNNALTTGQMGAIQLTAQRAVFANLRNASGAELGVAAAPLQVSLANTAANATPVTTSLSAAAAGGLSMFREIVPANTTSVAVKASAGQLYSIDAYSISASTPAYIKFYNTAQGSVTCGSGTPTFGPYMIPAAGGAAGSGFVMHDTIGFVFSTAITACVTAGIADTDTTAPAASTYVVNIGFR
jgi:hypothetical protein